jgi:hypothetical protein
MMVFFVQVKSGLETNFGLLPHHAHEDYKITLRHDCDDVTSGDDIHDDITDRTGDSIVVIRQPYNPEKCKTNGDLVKKESTILRKHDLTESLQPNRSFKWYFVNTNAYPCNVITHCDSLWGAFASRYHLNIYQRDVRKEVMDDSLPWEEIRVANYSRLWHLEKGGGLDVVLHYDTDRIYTGDRCQMEMKCKTKKTGNFTSYFRFLPGAT